MNQDDLSEAAARVGDHLSRGEPRARVVSKPHHTGTGRIKLSTIALALLIGWLVSHFSHEMASAVQTVSQEDIDDGANQLLGRAAAEIES